MKILTQQRNRDLINYYPCHVLYLVNEGVAVNDAKDINEIQV